MTGLAYGLAQDNRNAVDQWKADNILIAEDANDNLNMSMFPIKTYEEVNAEEKAILAQLPAVVSKKGTKETINAIFFGISPDQFLVPKIETGRMFETKNESVVDDSLRNQYGLQIGDQSFILAFLGVGIGLLATTVTSYLLPAQVPFETNSLFLTAISGLMVLFAVLGAFFSVRAVVKIDPLKAIG